MIYATPADLVAAAAAYGIPAPPPDARVRLLELAQRDVIRYLGTAWDPAAVLPEQATALRDATTAQACFRFVMGADAMLNVDDGLAGVGELRFSLRPTPRFSEEAAEAVAGHRLFTRSSTVPPDATG